MKALLIIAIAFLISACNPNQDVWDEIAGCKKLFKEECTVIVVPVSKGEEVSALYKKWRKDSK